MTTMDTGGARGASDTAADSQAAARPRASQRGGTPSLYHLILGSSMLILGMGLVMVLSASSVLSYKVFGSSFTLFSRQALFAALGVVLMFGISRMSVPRIRVLSWLVMGGSMLALVAVLVVGQSVKGQRNWIQIVGPFKVQPSEFAKLAIALWGAQVLATKEKLLDQYRHLIVPLLPVCGLMCLLVVIGGDAGNPLIMATMTAALLFAAGAPLRLFALLGVVGGAAIVALSFHATYRLGRFASWLDPSANAQEGGYQVLQARAGLGTGGWWGVGLGASREKWGSLPEAHTDFIYAVIGEELGLLGTLALLFVIGVLLISGLRLARNTSEPFIRYATTAIVAWFAVQMMLNIGGVLGLLPITGVPLPLVSYGGSSLVPSLMAVGALLAFAKHDARLAAQSTQAD